MIVLQRLAFPENSVYLPLYVTCTGKCTHTADALDISSSGEARLDGFSLACAFGPNGWPTTVGRVTCELFMQGSATVTLVARDVAGKERVLCSSSITENHASVLALEFASSDIEHGRVFAVVRALEGGARVFGGRYVCGVEAHEVDLAVVICTYKRESEVMHNIKTLCADKELMDAGVRVIVADNGRSLRAEDMPAGVTLLPGANLGGAGGFSRGIIAAQEQESTHVVLMDDDVVLNPESVWRCLAHFRINPLAHAVAGVLLDMEHPEKVQEAGAWVSRTGPPLRVRPGNSGVNLARPQQVDALLSTPSPDYGGFWLFAFALSPVLAKGVLMPFFIKGDDVEFCLRLKEAGMQIRLLAGVGVPHPGFISEFSMVKRYYWVRNMLAVRMLYGEEGRRGIISSLWGEAVGELRRYRYQHLACLVRGIEDFLKGPDFLERCDNGKLTRELLEEHKKLAPISCFEEQAKGIGRTRLFSWLSLFGHLLPVCFMVPGARSECLQSSSPDWFPTRFTQVDNGDTVITYSLRRRVGMLLYARMVCGVGRLCLGYASHRKSWRRAVLGMTSVRAWKKRLQI